MRGLIQEKFKIIFLLKYWNDNILNQLEINMSDLQSWSWDHNNLQKQIETNYKT